MSRSNGTEIEDQSGTEIPFSWFTVTLRKYIPYYVELVFLAICLRLIGLVEPFIFQVLIEVLSQILTIVGLIVVVGHSYPARAANCLNGR